jgi:hypothetical protein
LSQPYIHWDIAIQGSPDSVLSEYNYVIWFTGATRTAPMPAEDVDGIISYLDGGGRLLMTSQDFVQRLSERGSARDSLLLIDYLKVTYYLRPSDQHENGIAGTVFDSLSFYTSGTGGANNQASKDAFTVYPGGVVVLSYGTGQPAAVVSEANYRIVTAGFGAEGISDAFPARYNSKAEFLDAALRYLRQPVSVDERTAVLPEKLILSQNYPNPFNPSTQISFELPQAGPVTLEIYDILGRLIDKPVNGPLAAGNHQIVWNGNPYSSGVYFYKLVAGDNSQVKRMTLTK